MADEHSNDTTADEVDTPSAGQGWRGDGAGELSDIQRTLSALGTRIDALVTSTTSYRSAISDRLVEYTDTVSSLIRTQAGDVDEERQANQRLLSDLQQGAAASERAISALGDRLEELQAGGGDDDSKRLLNELRSVLDAQEGLSRFLTDALDQFGDRVTKTLTTAHEANVDQLDGLAQVVGAIREGMVDVASGEVVGALWDEVRSLRDSLGSAGAASSAIPGEVADDVARLADAVGALLEGAEVVGPDELGGSDDTVAALANEVARLRADFTEGLVVEPSGAMGETIDAIREELALVAEQLRALGADDDAELRGDIEELTDAVRTLLEQAELVDEDGAPLDGADDTGAVDDADDPDAADDAGVGSDTVVAAVAALRELIESTRTEVTAITERLDEGLVLDLEPSAEQQELADQVAGLRSDVAEQVTVDLDPVLDRLEAIGDEVAQLAASVSPASSDVSAFDADAIDVLRAEIQAIGAASPPMTDDVIGPLRDELVALRRRIKVRAEADVLSDEQLDSIAKAIADRLG